MRGQHNQYINRWKRIMRGIFAAHLFWVGLGLFLLPSTPAFASESDFPNRAVRVIVPFSAGGTADALPRIVGEKLGQRWQQPVIIENRSGAGGNIGAAAVAASSPDGYTLLSAPPGPIAINGMLYKKLPFDPSVFEPVTILGSVPNVLVVRSGFPAKTAKEAVRFIKANPGKVTFASQGNGSTSHLAALMFEQLAGLRMVHVPYRGTAPALQDIMGNNVDLFFDNLASSLSLNKAGKLRILAVGSLQRIAQIPDIPTMQEVGIRGFQSITWFGMVAPAGTPGAVVQRVNAAVADILAMSEVSDQFERIGVQRLGRSIQETRKFIADEVARWGKVIRDANVRIEE
jgi:tripartite-type tricarboxylate transporter receptor subunit TctC